MRKGLSRILARDTWRLRNKVIPLVKATWGNHRDEKVTWEQKDDVRKAYPKLLQEIPTFGEFATLKKKRSKTEGQKGHFAPHATIEVLRIFHKPPAKEKSVRKKVERKET